MKNIEKALKKFADGKGPRVGYKVLCENKGKSPTELINILAQLVSENLDKFTGSDSINKSIELLYSMTIILENCDDINRKIVTRKLQKLYEKISRIKIEKKKNLKKLNEACEKLDTLTMAVDEVLEVVLETENKKYKFMEFLITEIGNTDYLEYTLQKMPELVNAKDKNNNHILNNIVQKYLEYMKESNEREIFHYSNIISLILTQRSLKLSDKDQRDITSNIYKVMDQLNVTKAKAKKNKEKTAWLNNLITTIETMNLEEKNIEKIALKYKIKIDFEDKVKEEANLAKVPTPEDSNRYLVDDYIITIDKKGTSQIDDALSCKKLDNGNYLLGVHIASALSYFPYNSEIINTAISRARTIYLPTGYYDEQGEFNKIIPSLPLEFSTNTGSLIPNQPRYTRSYYYEIDNEGNVVDEKFLKTIVKSSKKTTYEEVNKILESGSSNKRLEELVLNLQAVTERLEKKYKPVELYEKIKESIDDYSDLKVKMVGSEKIIYEAMILTGNRVAEYFANSKEGYPCLYRIHEVNEKNNKKLQAMIENLTQTYGGNQFERLYRLLEGIYPKGWYGSKGKHQGLGLEHYCHCTSSLRRSADIVVEHALDVCYDNNPTDKELMELETEINQRAAEINEKMYPIEGFLKEYQKVYRKRRR